MRMPSSGKESTMVILGNPPKSADKEEDGMEIDPHTSFIFSGCNTDRQVLALDGPTTKPATASVASYVTV